MTAKIEKTLAEQFKAARFAGTPLVAVNTPDPQRTLELLCGASADSVPKFRWDVICGLQPVGAGSSEVYKEVVKSIDPETTVKDFMEQTCSQVFMLEQILNFPSKSIFFMQSAHRFVHERETAQAIWNLREPFKSTYRTLVLLAPDFKLPPEIANDVLILDEAYPGDTELRGKVIEIAAAGGLSEEQLGEEKLSRCVEAMHGLPYFAAESALAMSFVKGEGFDPDYLWKRKISMIEQTDGLKVNRDVIDVSNLRGLDEIVKFTEMLFHGKDRPTCIVRIDEIEKSLGGVGGDLSGVSTDQMGVILKEMEDNDYRGLIAVGFPGVGKSALTKAMGSMGGVPTIEIDLGAMKGELVGQSEQMIRRAFKVIKSIAGSGAFFVATCNDISNMKPELLRRYPYGRWFFDLFDEHQATATLDMYAKKYNVSTDDAPCMTNWTGAEIKSCCELADRLNIPLSQARNFITPYCIAEPDAVRKLRASAEGRFKSAAHPGVYKAPGIATIAPSEPGAAVQRMFGSE